MSLTAQLASSLWDTTVLLSLFACLLVAYIVKFYLDVRSLPPGPFPLPFIGNILQLRQPRPLFEKAIAWRAQYGDPFTIWLGHRPMIIATSKESFKEISGPFRNSLGGRMQTVLGDLQSRGYPDIIFSDFNPAWDTLRRVGHVAIRKYAKTDKLANLVAEKVDVEVERMFPDSSAEENGAKMDYIEYIEDIVNSVLAKSAFGAGFEKGSADYEEFRRLIQLFETEGSNGLPSDIMPILGWIFFRKENIIRGSINSFMAINDKMFKEAKDSYTPGASRHFTDALLDARAEFLAESRESAKYLTDEALRQAVFDIFGAGTGTTRTILSYSLLHLANDQELQDELRDEISGVLGVSEGGRNCLDADRASLPKINSFIQEVIRCYPAAPLSLPRSALVDVTLNGRQLPKGTNLLINLWAVNRDVQTWGDDANEFKPKRFMSASKEQINQGQTSFGIGSRSCPGEKMANADITYVLVRTLQKLKIQPPSGKMNLTPIDSDFQLDPLRQEILFTRLT